MEDVLAKMPAALAKHIESLIELSGFNTDPSARKKFIRNWLKKKAFFDKIVEHQGFHLVDRIEPGFNEGIIILTYSGSLLTLSPSDDNGKRELVYNSIELRKDVIAKTEDKNAEIVFPIELHKSLEARAGKVRKTSAILSVAVEEEPGTESSGIGKRMRIIGERISRSLILINKELFSRNTTESGLDERDDLFDKWIILTWFRIGGWEEAVFYERAKMLWLELFSNSFVEISEKIKDSAKKDEAIVNLSNAFFPKYVDDYKWLESEKKNFDIGLMKALEEIPGRKDYTSFVAEKVKALVKTD
jgi:hypothetical protein